MDELSPLFQNIEFRERLRGYDVEEVDAYIDRVAKAAALVQGRIAELQQRVEAAESRGGREPESLGDEQSLTRVLALAQRTADAAVEEAKQEAAAILDDARRDADVIRREADEHASRVMAEAETDRRRLLADSEREATEVAAAERSRAAAEVAELNSVRAFLAEDIELLERNLTANRLALAASLSALQDLLERPETFRSVAMPEPSGIEVPSALLTDDAEPADSESVDAESVDAELADAESVDAESVDAERPDDEIAREGVDDGQLVDTLVDDHEDAGADELVVAVSDAPADHVAVEPEPEFEQEPTTSYEALRESRAIIDAAMIPSDRPGDIHAETAPEITPEQELDAEPLLDQPERLTPEPLLDQPERLTPEALLDAELGLLPLAADEGTASDGQNNELVDEQDNEQDNELVDEQVETPNDSITADLLTFAPSMAEFEEVVAESDEAPVLAVPDDDRGEPELTSTIDLTEVLGVTAPTAPSFSDARLDAESDPEVDAVPEPRSMPEPPRLVTAADLDDTETWINEIQFDGGPSTQPLPVVTDQLLFTEPPSTSSDPFLEQLRDAVSGAPSDEFGDDALAAFFDEDDDPGGRNWFGRRR